MSDQLHIKAALFPGPQHPAGGPQSLSGRGGEEK